MCGIAGFYLPQGVTLPPTYSMDLAHHLHHRGPDGFGIARWQDGQVIHAPHPQATVALVQTRLAINDIAHGEQPFVSPEGVGLVANGEIYNHRHLRDLTNSPYPYVSHSDCEVILARYLHQGVEALQELRGFFAVAIVDPRNDTLILARDPLGIKPLYYRLLPEGGVIFASELEPLRRLPGRPESQLHLPALHQVLAYNFYSLRGASVWEDCHRVEPGAVLTFHKGRLVQEDRLTHKVRQHCLPPSPPAPRALEDEVRKAVAESASSDVPMGMFFSGGVDSTLLVLMLQALGIGPLPLISLVLPGQTDLEQHLHTLADHVQWPLTCLKFDEDLFWSLLPNVAACLDDPITDYATVPTYYLAQQAKAMGLKVVFSGEGGDELFAGYGRYRSFNRWSWWPWRQRPAKMHKDKLAKAPGLVLGAHIPSPGDLQTFDATQFLASDPTFLQRLQHHDIQTWLCDDLLIKLDRCLMAHGIEGRPPFLGFDLTTWSLGLPDALKIHNGVGKWLPKQLLDQLLPQARAFAPKQGFTMPLGRWIPGHRAYLEPLLRTSTQLDVLLPAADRDNFLNQPGVWSSKRGQQLIWNLTFLHHWLTARGF